MSDIKTLNGHNLVDTAATAKLNSVIETVGGDTLTWEYDANCVVSDQDGLLVVHISNAAPALADFAQGCVKRYFRSSGVEGSVDVTDMIDAGGGFLMSQKAGLFVVAVDNFEFEGMIFPYKGTYTILNGHSEDPYTRIELTIPGYTGFTTEKITPSALYQPDWNQNDASAPDYVKNRPFYDELSEIMPETEVVGELSDDAYGFTIDAALFTGAEGGLVVTFDGVEYTCAANAYYGITIFGNMSYINPTLTDTGEPFVIMPVQGVVGVADGNTHTMRICGVYPVKIPQRYMKTPRVFYIKTSADEFLYKDGSCSEKATIDDVIDAIENPPAQIRVSGLNIVFTALSAMAGDRYGTIKTAATTNDGTFYTAEYTAT